jgi:hypothetical protein
MGFNALMAFMGFEYYYGEASVIESDAAWRYAVQSVILISKGMSRWLRVQTKA